MQGVGFSFNGAEAWEEMTKLIESIYLETDSWDFEVVITKERETYYVWIGDKDE